jgi:hypothetical protein
MMHATVLVPFITHSHVLKKNTGSRKKGGAGGRRAEVTMVDEYNDEVGESRLS